MDKEQKEAKVEIDSLAQQKTIEGDKMLEGLTPKKQARPCKIRTVLDGLEAKDQKILEEAIANTEWSVTGLSKALNSRGISISDTPIASHRSGRCSCVRQS